MALWNRKPQGSAAEKLPEPARLHKADEELVSIAEMNGVEAAIERAVRKGLTAAHYVAFDNIDDQGGYFGTEFELRTTAGRIKGLYSREPWIYAAASHIARTLAQVPMKAYVPGTDREIEKHPVLDIWRQGSPTQSQKELRWTENLDLVLGGNFFLLFEQDMKTVAGLAPVELVNLQYTPNFDGLEAIDVYSVGTGTQYKRFPMSQVAHIKLPNPYNFLYGMSPFCAAARPILLDRYKNEYEMAFYLRGATMPGVVETTEDLSKSRFQRLMRTFENIYTGRSNWWRTLFLPKGATWKSSSITMREMEHLEGLKENRKSILAVLGVPPSLVGLIEDVNRATAEQQERVYWQNTIVPLAWFVAAGWNNSYLFKTVWKGKVEFRPDFSGIEAVEGFVSAKQEKAVAMQPYFLIDEIREEVFGAAPLPNGIGQKFVAEIKASSPAPLSLAAPPAAEKAAIPTGMEVVCLYLMKERFPTEGSAAKWAADNGFRYNEVRDNVHDWIMPQGNPDDYAMMQMQDVALTDGVRATCAPRKKDYEDEVRTSFHQAKAQATGSQNRIEGKLASGMHQAVKFYIDDLIGQAKDAILRKAPVRQALHNRRSERERAWMVHALPVLELAMERGFSAANSQVKRVVSNVKRAGFPGLNETDRQAVDAIRERTREGKRRQLQERSIERFQGLDETRTEAVMQIIEDGEKEGLSYEEIARQIRDRYDEAYDNQARTIVRTEILSAVSQGLQWNHEALGTVFSDVRKQWMHQGDEGINSDARQGHVDIDGVEVGKDEKWTVTDPKTGDEAELSYPRDPSAPAGEVINCRCTMVSVIPEGATSNAEAILED